MNKAQRILLSLLISVVVLAGAAPGKAEPLGASQAFAAASVLAAPPFQAAAACDELQVIAIADQSGSMAGYTDDDGHFVPATDPQGFRFEGPRHIVDTLLGIHYASGFQDTQFKAAIIDFGDTPQVRMGWTDLNPKNDAEADARAAELASVFDPTPAMGNTVPGDAVQQAASLFAQQNAIRPQVDGCPRRVIILFTDGLPFSSTPGFSTSSHLSQLATYAKNNLPYPDNRIYVIGLDQNNAFYDQTLQSWIDVTGSPDQVFLTTDSAEMGSAIARILNAAVDGMNVAATARGCADNGRIIIPPYMQLVRISLFKVEDNLHLEINDPFGQSVRDGRPNVTITGETRPVETVTINNPQPGEWRVLTQLPAGTDSECLVTFIAIVAEEEVVEPQAGAEYPQFTSVPIVFQLVDSAGNSLPDYGEDQYDLQMDVGLTYGSGEKQPLSWNANPGQEYRGEIIPRYIGPADVTVFATARDDNSKDYEIFPNRSIASFQVTPVRFIGQDLPADGLRVAQHSELPLEFAVVDTNGQPVTLDLPVTIELALVDEAGTVAPQPAPTQDNSSYKHTLALPNDGLQTLTYNAFVTVPAQAAEPERTVALGDGELALNVFPVHFIRAEFGDMGGVATDPLLRPTGLSAVIRLADENGQPISPAAVGAPDPMSVFDVTIRSQDDGQVLMQGEDLLTTTGEPGVFQLVNNDLGRGDYTIEVRSASPLAENYAWEAPEEWTAAASGLINPLVWAVTAATVAVGALAAVIITGQARVRQHPLSGQIVILEGRHGSAPDGSGTQVYNEHQVYSAILSGKKNKYVLKPDRAGITKIIVTSPNKTQSEAGQATVKIFRKSGPPVPGVLSRGGRIDMPGESVAVMKDPSASQTGSGGANTPTLDSTFN